MEVLNMVKMDQKEAENSLKSQIMKLKVKTLFSIKGRCQFSDFFTTALTT